MDTATKPSAPTLGSGSISLTFTAKKKPAIVVAVQEEEKKQEKDFITGIEGTKIKSVNPVVAKGPLVIPMVNAPINRTYVRKPPKDPLEAPDPTAITDRFESSSAAIAAVDAAENGEATEEMAIDQAPKGSDASEVKKEVPAAEGAPNVKYGLNIIKKEKEVKAEPLAEFAPGDVPLAMRNRPAELYARPPHSNFPVTYIRSRSSDAIDDEDERFRLDVASRPDQADEAAYEAVPVEAFGEALLRGMGWEEGKGLGKNGTGMSVPIEFVKRPHRLGLGAVPKAPEPKQTKRFIKPGESRDPKPAMMVAPDRDGKQRSYRTLDEQLVPVKYKVVEPGASIAIVSGQHEGLLGRVLTMSKDAQKLTVRLRNEEVVDVTRDQVELMTSLSSAHQQPQSDDEDEDGDDTRVSAPPAPSSTSAKRAASDSARSDGEKKSRSASSASGSSSSAKKTWLRPHIIVRVVSKSFENGKYYQKKGRIEDVINGDECTLRLEGRIVDRVRERNVQTVVPKAGGRVLILTGSLTGRVGTVLETRDSKDVIVQMLDDMQIKTYAYDDVSEYHPD